MIRNSKGQFIKGNNPPFKGKIIPQDVKDKMKKSRKEFFDNGGKVWNKGTKGVMKKNSGSFSSSIKKFNGTEEEYKKLHYRIRKNFGEPEKCMMCRSKENLAWANKSGDYLENREDWISLCYRCHFVYDLTEKRREKSKYKKMNGIFFRGGMNENFIPEILKEMYRDRVYDNQLNGKKDLVVIDAGANISLFSQFVSDKASIVYAIEPSEEHFECILKAKNFNCDEKIFPIKLAISNQNGTAKFYHNDNTTMYSLSEAVNTKNEFEEVEAITLDKLFEEYNINHVDFMKIDIEGAEAQVFGGEGFDKVKDRIDIIMGEFHTWSGVNPKQFESYFRDRNFTFEWVNKTEASLFLAERIR